MTDRVKNIIIGLLFLALIVMAVVAVTVMPGCMSAPKRDFYSTDECFTAMDCLYRLKDSKEKSACAALVESCRDTLKEERFKSRLEYCKRIATEKFTEGECRLILNQK